MINHKKHYLTTAEYSVLTGSKRFTNGNVKKNRRDARKASQAKPSRTNMVENSPSDSKVLKFLDQLFENIGKLQ
ncbi:MULTISPECIES: hypothetical protein [Amylolactobacillus]|nr:MULTISPECIES: hypothetical protein [Amylolactobacillus]APT18014.1 hypothetical protein LA20533_01170 [Amylolactobacillus amylophilus DSM 20533 = JCM 1125]